MSSLVDKNRFNCSAAVPKRLSSLPWLICGFGAIFYSYEYLLRILPSVMTSQLMQHYQVNAATFGILTAMYYFVYTPMQLIVGLLMDLYGPRRLLTFACLICVIGTYLFGGVPNLYVAGAGRFLIGFGSAFAFVGVLKLATIWLPPHRMALVSGLASALGKVGAMTGNVVMTSLVEQLGWQNAILVSATVGVLLTVLLWLVIRDYGPNAAVASTSMPEISLSGALNDFLLILKNSQIWINGVVSCLLYLPTTVFAELWGKTYLEHVFGLSETESGYAVSTLFLGFAIGAPLSGLLSDFIGRRCPLITVASFGSCILFSLLIFMPGMGKMTIHALLFCLGLLYSSHVLSFAISRDITPDHAVGTAIAVTNMIIMLGGFVCQPLVGCFLDLVAKNSDFSGLYIYTAHDYRLALSIVPVGILLAGILSFWLKETRYTSQP